MVTALKIWRISNNMAQEKLSAKSGVTTRQIDRIEKGGQPDKNEFRSLKKAGVPADQFWPELVRKYTA